MDLISVVVPVYNEKIEWIEACLVSLINQTYNLTEIIVVIDTEDHSINEVVKKYEEKDSRIRHLRNEKNMGLVRSLNRGIAQAKGTYIARMDADDIAHLDRLEKELAFLKENQLDFVSSDVDTMNENGEVTNRFSGKSIYPENMSKLMTTGNLLKHPTWLIKKEVYTALEGYRNIRYTEDYDFSLRALENGYRIGKIGEGLVDYRIRQNSISRMNALDQFLTSDKIRKAFNKKQLTVTDPERLQVTMSAEDSKTFLKKNEQFLEALTGNNSGSQRLKLLVSSLANKYIRKRAYLLFRYKLTMKKLMK